MITKYGRMIRKLRSDNNVTLLDMSDAIGYSCSELSGIECGRHNCNLTPVIFNETKKFFSARGINFHVNFRQALLMSSTYENKADFCEACQ